MKNIMNIPMIILLSSGLITLQANPMKKYDVKSGKIEYTLKGSGNIMGMVQIKSVGKKRVIFDDYGVTNLEEENKVKKETTMGETKVNKNHTLIYMNNAIVYRVDFKKKRINRMRNSGAQIAAMFGGGKNLKESGESIMKSMGGNKIGTDKVLGYTCDVWDLMGSKQCIYKGIPLKIEINVMGMKSTEIATKATFDLTLSKDDFKLPDFPIYDMQGNVLDKNNLDAMDAKVNADNTKDMDALSVKREAYMKAQKDAGIQEGQSPSKAQEEAMLALMMQAMGGEKSMLEQSKNEILKDAHSGIIEFSKECYGAANTLKEANKCVDTENQKFHSDEEYLQSWTAEDKKEMREDIKSFEKAIPCIEKAQTMDMMRGCMS